MILDQTQDLNGQEIHRLSSLYNPPEFVKAASSTDICGEENLRTTQRHVFADRTNGLYPCHTAPATWVSAAFFAEKQAGFKPKDRDAIKLNLLKMASYFGMKGQVEELFKKVSSVNSNDLNQLTDDMFAYVWQPVEGDKQRHLPLRNGNEVKRASEYLLENRDHFAMSERQVMADKILVKANAYGASIPEDMDNFLHKTAGHGACSATDAAELVMNRLRGIGKSQPVEVRETLAKMAKAMLEHPSQTRNPESLKKLAVCIDMVDRNTGLAGNYTEFLPRPEEVLFQINQKVAEQVLNDYVSMTSGNIYKLADLENLNVQDVRDWMGSDFADAVSVGGVRVDAEKLASIAPTLPRPDAETFDRFVSEVGVVPFAKESAHEPIGPTREEMFEYAGAYTGAPQE